MVLSVEPGIALQIVEIDEPPEIGTPQFRAQPRDGLVGAGAPQQRRGSIPESGGQFAAGTHHVDPFDRRGRSVAGGSHVIFLIADLQAPAEQQIVIPVVFGERLADYPVEHGRRRGGKIEVAGKIPVTAHLPCPELVRPAEIATRKTERREMRDRPVGIDHLGLFERRGARTVGLTEPLGRRSLLHVPQRSPVMDALDPAVRIDPGIFERGQRAAESLVDQRIGGLDPVRKQFPVMTVDIGQRPGHIESGDLYHPGPVFGKGEQHFARPAGESAVEVLSPALAAPDIDDGGSPHSGNRTMFAGGDQVGFTLLVDPVVARVERLERHFVHILESRPLPERFADHQAHRRFRFGADAVHGGPDPGGFAHTDHQRRKPALDLDAAEPETRLDAARKILHADIGRLGRGINAAVHLDLRHDAREGRILNPVILAHVSQQARYRSPFVSAYQRIVPGRHPVHRLPFEMFGSQGLRSCGRSRSQHNRR